MPDLDITTAPIQGIDEGGYVAAFTAGGSPAPRRLAVADIKAVADLAEAALPAAAATPIIAESPEAYVRVGPYAIQVSALLSALDTHGHAIDDVAGLQAAIDAAMASGGGSGGPLANGDYGLFTVASLIATAKAGQTPLTALANQAQATLTGRPAAAGTGAPSALSADQISAIIQTLTTANKLALFRALGIVGTTPANSIAMFDALGSLIGTSGGLVTPDLNTYPRYDGTGTEQNLSPAQVCDDLVANGLTALVQSASGNFSLTLTGRHSAVFLTLTGNATLTGISASKGWAGPGGDIPLYVIQDATGNRTLAETGGTIIPFDSTTLTDIGTTANSVTRFNLRHQPNGDWWIIKPPRQKAILDLGNVSGNFAVSIKDNNTAVKAVLTGNGTLTSIGGAIDGGPCGTIELFVTQDATGGRTLLETAGNLATIGTDALTLNTAANTTTILIIQAKPDGTFAIMNSGRSY